VALKRTKLRRTRLLNTAANVALLVSAVAVCASSALDIHGHLWQSGSKAPASSTPAPMPGVPAPKVAGIDYRQSDRTLVLFLSTRCKFCRMSAPFYRELSSRVAKDSRLHRIVAVFPEGRMEVSGFITREQLGIDVIPDVRAHEYGITGTPTAVLVARDGVVQRSWVGAVNKEAQTDMIHAFIGSE